MSGSKILLPTSIVSDFKTVEDKKKIIDEDDYKTGHPV